MCELWCLCEVFICTCKLETLFQATYSENQFSWHSLHPWSQVLAASFFPHSLHVRPGFGVPESRQASIPCCPLPASRQLNAFHPALFFSTAESSLQVTLGTGRLRRKESLAECVVSQTGLSWGWTLPGVRAAPAPQPRSKHASLWCSDKGQLFHSQWGEKVKENRKALSREHVWSNERRLL